MDALCSRPAGLLAFQVRNNLHPLNLEKLQNTQPFWFPRKQMETDGNRWKQANFRINLVPSSKLSHNYGKSPFLVGKYTISTGPCSMSQTVS